MRRMLPMVIAILMMAAPSFAADAIPPVNQRFASGKTAEVPGFRRHIMPLLGRLGCNGRACHGSFQGRGGFRLSLFGYDFKADHKSMHSGDEPRINKQQPLESLVLQKPTHEEIHEGGKRMDVGSWEYNLFKQWVVSGAKPVADNHPKFLGLKITPQEIIFARKGQKTQLKVIARWANGQQEDVTPLCRFKTNSAAVAGVDKNGIVTAAEAGDTHVVVFYDIGVVPVPVMRPVTDRVGSRYPNVSTPTRIDRLVVDKLRKIGIVPSSLSTDAEFLRRASLDLTGTLPAPKEVESFLADKSPDKRTRKIDEMLKSKAYAAWWTTKLCDITGNNDDGLVNVIPVRGRASQDWYDWIYKRVANNTPYDKLVEGIVVATSRNKGESYEQFCKEMSAMYKPNPTKKLADRDFMPYYWARRTFRRPEERAIGFAYTFLGMRIQCAQCHKHPFDRWTKNDFEQFKGFFASTQSGVRDRKEYTQMLSKLGVKNKRGNQARRELAKLLAQGKTVPFQEVYAGRSRGRRRGNIGNALRNLRKQIKRIQQRIVAAKKAGNTKQQKLFKKRLTAINKRFLALRKRGNTGGSGTAKLLGGKKIDLSKLSDPRLPLMAWLRDSKHGMLSRAFVNRVWAAYFNVGIINPPDDLSLGNPPSNKPLLDYLTRGFIQSGYDMKWLHREILTSRTYQLSWHPNETNRKDERNFSHAIPRRLPAEVAYDALQQATSSDAVHAAARTNIKGRAIAIPGAGRRNRNNRGAAYALTIFGRSVRENNCDCDRSSDASLLQTVYLQNDQDVYAMIQRNRDGWLQQIAKELGIRFRGTTTPNNRKNRRRPQNLKQIVARLQKRLKQAKKTGKKKTIARIQRQIVFYKKRFGKPQRRPAKTRTTVPQTSGKKVASLNAKKIVRQAYLRTLSRYPNEKEMRTASSFLDASADTIAGVRNLMWALLNTKEFIVNH